MNTADVIVVGAGAVGCSVAAHLARLRPELGVALIDRAHVGAGSTSRSMAAFRHQWSVPAHVAFSRYASSEYDRLAAAGHPIAFRRHGYLFLYTDPGRLRDAAVRVRRQRDLGVEGVEVLEAGRLRTAVACGDSLFLDDLAGATWGPRDGFLDPLAVAQGYLEEARNAGVDYLPRRRLAAVLRASGGNRVSGVKTEGGDAVSAPVVVNAAGVWSAEAAGLAGLDLPVRPAKRYIYHSRPVTDRDVSSWPLVIGDRGAHVRPGEGNCLMMAWERRPRPLEASPGDEALWEGQDRIDEGFGIGPGQYGFAILEELSRHLPFLAESVALAHATCGWYAVTPDHKAILGEDPRLPGLFHATGFSGHGIMHAAPAGLTVAELILGRGTTLGSPSEIEAAFGLRGLLERGRREPVEDMVL